MDEETKKSAAENDKLANSFVATLLLDVQATLDRVENKNKNTDRRTALRTIVSAIEGLCWLYRKHVRSIASDLDLLSPQMELALHEKKYSISDNGNLIEQIQFQSITSMFRLVTNLAKNINSIVSVDFGDVGWANLKAVLLKRNKLMHPKSIEDLAVSNADITNAVSALFWLLEVIESVMELTNAQAKDALEELVDIVEKLKSGDPQTLRAYAVAQRDI